VFPPTSSDPLLTVQTFTSFTLPRRPFRSSTSMTSTVPIVPQSSNTLHMLANTMASFKYTKLHLYIYNCCYYFVDLWFINCFEDCESRDSGGGGEEDGERVEGVLWVAGEWEAEELLRRPFQDNEAFHQFQCEDRESFKLERLLETSLPPPWGLHSGMAFQSSIFQV